MEEAAEDREKMTSQQVLCVPDQKDNKQPGLSTLKSFIVALSFAYFSKALTGTYMKSSITQIERRFDLSSTHIGLVDGSFEMGNLLFLAVVSYFGAKLHRPRLIAAGCFLMAVGALLTGLTHFFMGRYRFDTVVQVFHNGSVNTAACEATLEPTPNQSQPSVEDHKVCVREPGSNMWIYVFMGNALRGIGETPVTPLGISYIDDFAKAENAPFYIACLQTITLLGPMFGFLLGSYCARLYVDIGYVDIDSVTITPNDSRWVGAWWMGFLVSSALLLMSGIPFWFLPRSLPTQEGDRSAPTSETLEGTEDVLINSHSLQLTEIAKGNAETIFTVFHRRLGAVLVSVSGLFRFACVILCSAGFLPSLKRLLGTPAYFLLLCGSILKFNAIIGLFTFKAKYMEQQFGQSASRANFLIGVLNLPAFAVGIFLGGLLMKRYKLSVVSGAQLSFATSFMAYLLLLLQFGTKCENIPVAGLTVPYNGTPAALSGGQAVFSACNRNCSCSAEDWDPVCSDDGITYVSPCMAGCLSSSGHGRNTVFRNCSCVSGSDPAGSNRSVRLGQCPHAKDCSRSFTSYMAVSVLSSFINSLGATPGYMVIIRCISPELKSLALGIHTLVTRTLGGIPAPVYFGALIDSTCLKWSVKKCGGRGTCRIYDSNMYRIIFLGLITSLSGSSYFFVIAVIVLLRRQFRRPRRDTETQRPKAAKDVELKTTSSPTEGQAGAPQPQTTPHTPKAGRPISTNDTGPKTPTEPSAELTSEGGKVETKDELTEGNYQISKYQTSCERADAGQSHSKETDDPREQNVKPTTTTVSTHQTSAF